MELRVLARELFKSAEPIAHSLLLMEAMMLPDSPRHSSTCNDLMASALALHENDANSSASAFASALRDSAALVQTIKDQGKTMLLADGMEVQADDAEVGKSHKTILQLWYRRHLLSRSWSRRRITCPGSSGHYVASALASVVRGAARMAPKE